MNKNRVQCDLIKKNTSLFENIINSCVEMGIYDGEAVVNFGVKTYQLNVCICMIIQPLI